MNNEVGKDILDKTVDLISKRAYYYGTSGPGKRLPNYDFGLGKRSKYVLSDTPCVLILYRKCKAILYQMHDEKDMEFIDV